MQRDEGLRQALVPNVWNLQWGQLLQPGLPEKRHWVAGHRTQCSETAVARQGKVAPSARPDTACVLQRSLSASTKS
jgi:hypothetical protein